MLGGYEAVIEKIEKCRKMKWDEKIVAIRKINNYRILSRNSGEMEFFDNAERLKGLFLFRESSEGIKYWSDICEKIGEKMRWADDYK